MQLVISRNRKVIKRSINHGKNLIRHQELSESESCTVDPAMTYWIIASRHRVRAGVLTKTGRKKQLPR